MTQRFRSLLLTAFFVPSAAFAATMETTDNGFMFEQKGDQYRFGDLVSLPAPFPGDVFAAGQTVTIDERVSANLNAAGTTVIVNTTVGGNVRALGQNIIIRGIVEGSVLAVGGTVTLQDGARVNGDITAIGGKVNLEGTVAGNAFLRGDMLHVRTITGNLDARGSSVSINGTVNGDAVLVGMVKTPEGARINGNLRYWSPEGAVVDETIARSVQFDDTLALRPRPEEHKAEGVAAGLLGAVSVFALLSAAFIVLVTLPLMPKVPKEAAKTLAKHPWMSLGWGLLFFFGIPAISLLLLLSVFGIPLAVIAMMKFVAGLLLARIFASIVLVHWVALHRKATWNLWIIGLLSVCCYAVLHIINVVPVVGWLVSTVLILMGFGALLSVTSEKIRKVL